MPFVVIVFSQVAWFACVLGAAQGNAWIGPAVVFATVGFAALALGRARETVQLALVAGVIGLVLECIMLASGRVTYATPGPFATLPPAWLLGLWIVFSVLPNTALKWLHGRRGLQAVAGAAGAPLAYLAGERLGAMTFHDPVPASLAMLALLWAIAFPILMAAAEKMKADQPAASSAPQMP